MRYHALDLKSDLMEAVKEVFAAEGICDPGTGDANQHLARYLEASNRLIHPQPREARFSDELESTLASLRGASDPKRREAHDTALRLKEVFEKGNDVKPYLTRRIKDNSKPDLLLHMYGLHHFHLSKKLHSKSGYVYRSDYLLIAKVTPEVAYFIDVTPHHTDDETQWVQKRYLEIINNNWPELLDPYEIHGGRATIDTTDQDLKRLHEAGINVIQNIGDRTVVMMGGGGRSAICLMWADRYIRMIERIEDCLRKHIALDNRLGLKLVSLNHPSITDEQCRLMARYDNDFGKLAQLGFCILETNQMMPLAWFCEDCDKRLAT